ncbi:MAG: CBS domain-containing protein [Firmicutes bacterium]|nr:CBS domain-containing protein [Bacillota bacterium]MBR3405117.1 CBS domain-containing protein [Bacillota bacterium]
MNVAMFLSPKSEIAFLYDDMTLRQAMEKMEYHRYQCLPVLTRDGRYSGVVTEGDLLWAFKKAPDFTFADAEHMMLSDVPRHFHYNAIQIDQDMDSLITAAYLQSFVPVVDDQETFIGLIKRSDIIAYIYRRYNKLKSKLSDIEQGNMTYSGGTWSGGF